LNTRNVPHSGNINQRRAFDRRDRFRGEAFLAELFDAVELARAVDLGLGRGLTGGGFGAVFS
jgi:hypothetical protein